MFLFHVNPSIDITVNRYNQKLKREFSTAHYYSLDQQLTMNGVEIEYKPQKTDNLGSYLRFNFVGHMMENNKMIE